MTQYNTIAESNNFIVLDAYTKYNELHEPSVAYQSEASLEREFIQDLVNQGYEYRPDISTPEELLANARMQIQNLNDVVFSDKEWLRFVEEYLDKPGDTLIDKTHKIHDNHIYDFVFDDGHIKNIYIADKQNIAHNKVQVINQFEQTRTQANRYDVTILVNGLPLVHVELKKRGVAIREAFNQVHRYSKESSIRFTAIPKKVSIATILSSNIFKCLSFQTVRTAVILPIRLSATKTALTLP